MTKGHMGVNFNGLRRSAMDSCDALVRVLNAAHEHGHDVSAIRGLEEAVSDLRRDVACVGLVFREGDPEFQDVCGDREMLQLSWLDEEGEENG